MIIGMIAREAARSSSRNTYQPPQRPYQLRQRPVQRPVRWNEAVDQAWSTQGGRWVVAACWVAVPTFVILVMIFGTWTH